MRVGWTTRRPSTRRSIASPSTSAPGLAAGRGPKLSWRSNSASVESVKTKAAAEIRASTTESTRSEEHTSELQSRFDIVCRLLLEKKNKQSFASKLLKQVMKLCHPC